MSKFRNEYFCLKRSHPEHVLLLSNITSFFHKLLGLTENPGPPHPENLSQSFSPPVISSPSIGCGRGQAGSTTSRKLHIALILSVHSVLHELTDARQILRVLLHELNRPAQ